MAAERYVLSVALLVPLAIAAISIGQLAGTSFAGPQLSFVSTPDLQLKRPALVQVRAPPTLAPATPTPKPTPTTAPSPTPRPKTYTVKAGDELKHIAADYGVDIFKLIRANDIPNPDSLRIGQVLKIPDD
jgi:LysM repeat protein